MGTHGRDLPAPGVPAWLSVPGARRLDAQGVERLVDKRHNLSPGAVRVGAPVGKVHHASHGRQIEPGVVAGRRYLAAVDGINERPGRPVCRHAVAALVNRIQPTPETLRNKPLPDFQQNRSNTSGP